MVCVTKALTSCGSALDNLMPFTPLNPKIEVFLHLEGRGAHSGFGDGGNLAGPGVETVSLWSKMGWGSRQQ